MKKKLTELLLMIGIPEAQADVLYATGFLAPDEVVVYLRGKQRLLVTSPMEYLRARGEARNVRVISSRELILSKETVGTPTDWAEALLRRERVRRCSVPGWTPVGVVKALEARGIRVTVKPLALAEERAVKSAVELAAIRRAQRAAVSAMRAAFGALATASIDRNNTLRLDGRVLTSERLRTLIEVELLAHGCSAVGGTIASCGEETADPHGQGAGPLYAHRPIILDIFPRSRKTGYWGDMTRTVVKGTAPEEIIRMHAAVCAARRAALAMIRPGADAGAVHARVQEVFAAKGFCTKLDGKKPCGFIHSTGHGVGLDIHEAPRISTIGGTLQAGHVITVEPGLYYPGIGGVRVEDTFVVTSTGCRCLAPLPLGLSLGF
ncbi:MAG: M24 family metallopeptidase [Kiritimatiellae bacterium]|nr:M24 family metallopeptidase [Kiritimatiellia bacterium]